MYIMFLPCAGKLIETEEQDDASENEKGNSSSSKKDGKEAEGPTLTFVKQMPTGDIVVKRSFGDTSDTIHLRKAIRLSSDSENRSMLQIKPEFIKKGGDHENQILIPIKLHTASDFVKDIQNTLLVNKNKTLGDKKQGVHNQNVSGVNCVRQSMSESDSNSFLKTRKISKLEDVVNESSKKFKRNEC